MFGGEKQAGILEGEHFGAEDGAEAVPREKEKGLGQLCTEDRETFGCGVPGSQIGKINFCFFKLS